jgi:hypothetical protein
LQEIAKALASLMYRKSNSSHPHRSRCRDISLTKYFPLFYSSCGNSNTKVCYKDPNKGRSSSGVSKNVLAAGFRIANCDVEDLKWFKKADESVLEKKISKMLCKTGKVGMDFVKAVIRAANKDGRKSMTCEEYLVYSFKHVKSYHGTGVVPNPSSKCKLSHEGEDALKRFRHHVKELKKKHS